MKIFHFSFLLSSIIAFALLYTNRDVAGVETCTFCVLCCNMIYALCNIKKRFVFMMFQITFLVFLLGQNFASALSFTEGVFRPEIKEFPIDTQLHIYLTLFISLIGVFIGYALNESKYRDSATELKFSLDSIYMNKLRYYSKNFMYFLSIFAASVSLEKAIFVQNLGYVEYYVSFDSHLPAIFYRLESMYEMSVYLFLATFPRWKECRFPLLLYLLIGCMSLGYGQRNGMMLTMIFIVIYFCIRHQYKFYGNSEVWINKTRIIIVSIAIPFMLFFMYTFGSTRVDEIATEYGNLLDNTLAFFDQQGGSVRLIGYEKEFSDSNMFPTDVPPYTFGYLIDLFQQNAIFRAFNVYPSYESLSTELAMKGHNFSQTITYLYNPNHYFMGFGLGSCYIAETHHDFGIIGVFIINFLYGLIIALFHKYIRKNTWSLFAGFVIIPSILYAPRAGALSFINLLIAPSTIIFVVIMHLLTKKYKNIRPISREKLA